MANFLQQNFFVLLATALFLTVFFTWVNLGRPDDLNVYVNGLFGSVLTALGIRLRFTPGDPPPTINADKINADEINAGEIKNKEIEK